MTAKLASILTIIVVGTGCAAKTTGGTIGQADSQSAGDALGNNVEDDASAFGPVNAGAAFDGSCITLSGNVADTDADNIPAAATLTFDCSETRLGYTGMVTGTETVTDTQPTAAAWAFTATADLHSSLTGGSAASIVSDRSGQIVATQASAVGPFGLARSLDVVTVFTSALHTTATVTETTDWTIEFTPQVSWTPGGAAVTGTLTATGMWNVAVGANTADATLATPTPLTLTPTCATRVTAGTVSGTYQGNARTNTISVTWTGCGQRTVSFTEQ
jgi:hypothetical protein